MMLPLSGIESFQICKVFIAYFEFYRFGGRPESELSVHERPHHIVIYTRSYKPVISSLRALYKIYILCT